MQEFFKSVLMQGLIAINAFRKWCVMTFVDVFMEDAISLIYHQRAERSARVIKTCGVNVNLMRKKVEAWKMHLFFKTN